MVVFFFFIDGGEKLSISYPTPFIQSLLCVILSPALKSHICVTSLHVNHNRVIFMSRDQVQKMCVCVFTQRFLCVMFLLIMFKTYFVTSIFTHPSFRHHVPSFSSGFLRAFVRKVKLDIVFSESDC